MVGPLNISGARRFHWNQGTESFSRKKCTLMDYGELNDEPSTLSENARKSKKKT